MATETRFLPYNFVRKQSTSTNNPDVDVFALVQTGIDTGEISTANIEYPFEGDMVVDADTVTITSADTFEVNAVDVDINGTTVDILSTTNVNLDGVDINVTATADLNLISTIDNIIISAADSFEATAVAGDVNIIATVGQIDIYTDGDDQPLNLYATGKLDFTAAGAVDINAGTTVTVDSGTTMALTSGTGTTITATTNNISLVATHASGRVAIDGTKLLFNALAVLLENAAAYANDTAAGVGGINVGALYVHTDGYIHTRLS